MPIEGGIPRRDWARDFRPEVSKQHDVPTVSSLHYSGRHFCKNNSQLQKFVLLKVYVNRTKINEKQSLFSQKSVLVDYTSVLSFLQTGFHKKKPVFWDCIRWLGWACSSLNIAKLFFFTLSINRLYSQQAFKCETVNKNDILTQFVAFWELSATCLFWPPCWCNIICIMADEHNIVFVVYYFFWCRQ